MRSRRCKQLKRSLNLMASTYKNQSSRVMDSSEGWQWSSSQWFLSVFEMGTEPAILALEAQKLLKLVFQFFILVVRSPQVFALSTIRSDIWFFSSFSCSKLQIISWSKFNDVSTIKVELLKVPECYWLAFGVVFAVFERRIYGVTFNAIRDCCMSCRST